MNKCKRLTTRNRKPDNREEAQATKNMTLQIEHGDSSDSSDNPYALRVSGHSTPIQKREQIFHAEDSPDSDYRCSPIMLPCTQEGGNEIAWDWHSSVSKSTADKIENIVDTPKRTKLLQKKRNNNSPLLQKPHKRKQVKMENIENIGKLTAELKALTERMKNMKQNEEKKSDPRDDTMLEVVEEEKVAVQTSSTTDTSKKGSSYEDLFDDSIDASMAKCSQQVEEKFNLCRSKESDVCVLSAVKEKGGSSSSCEKEILNFTSSISVDSSKNSSTSNYSSTSNASSYLKSYAKNSSKTNSTLNRTANSSATAVQKPYVNNNVKHVENGNTRGKHTLRKESKLGVCEIPDDSFDDCLAMCIEDEKLLSQNDVYLFPEGPDDQTKCNAAKANSRKLNNIVSRTLIYPETQTNARSATATSETMENRKFFKTKSLSDQYFQQNSNASNRDTKSSGQVQAAKSVSSAHPTVSTQNSFADNNLSFNRLENTHALNRSAEKDGGSCIIKYKSTGHLYSNTETAKTTQPVQCTPEEIERKRLDAKMRLEAKRKLQQNTMGCSGSFPIKRPVKR